MEMRHDNPEIVYSDVVTIGPYWEHEEHIRPVWKLYWNKSAGASLKVNQRVYELDENTLCLISPMTRYEPSCPADTEHLYIHFQLPGSLSHMPRGVWILEPGGLNRDRARRAVLKGAKGYGDYLVLQNLLCSALSRLPSSLFEEQRISPLYELFLWLEDHLAEACRNEDLAEVLGSSVDTLNRLFKKETGRSPQSFIRDLRISHAANALKQSDLSIDAIAESCGFYDRSHFHRLFTRRTGLSPSRFRIHFLGKSGSPAGSETPQTGGAPDAQ